ncbi:hypothetical protein [Sporolactobacillus laevolacticus]|uniref:hypothetical protein n=1 Tax=Sporolactobacillus laevolacticus TaxID=33018 RepID=UPI0025B62600|nr:hypothetical protein [Sporolactobacillus laevolacticus]MDN3956807.1 hypothetical protein [Sporolactobacillus laevolacticus]
MRENRKLRNLLIMQSFIPLAILLLLKYFQFGMFKLILCGLWNRDISVINKAIFHKGLLIFLVMIGCICWIIRGLISIKQFRDVQNANFIEGDKIKISGFSTDSGLIFFVTFIIPLVLDDIGKLNNFLVFNGLVLMVILLMRKSNLYYQNPVLTILGYKTFRFKFVDKDGIANSEKDLIGITYGKIDEDLIIKYQRIADNVYLIYNKNT